MHLPTQPLLLLSPFFLAFLTTALPTTQAVSLSPLSLLRPRHAKNPDPSLPPSRTPTSFTQCSPSSNPSSSSAGTRQRVEPVCLDHPLIANMCHEICYCGEQNQIICHNYVLGCVKYCTCQETAVEKSGRRDYGGATDAGTTTGSKRTILTLNRSRSALHPRTVKKRDPFPRHSASSSGGSSLAAVELLCMPHPAHVTIYQDYCRCGEHALTYRPSAVDCENYCFCHERRHGTGSDSNGGARVGRGGVQLAIEADSTQARGRRPTGSERTFPNVLRPLSLLHRRDAKGLDLVRATPPQPDPTPRNPFEDSPPARSRLSRSGDMVLICTGHPIRERNCLDRCKCETDEQLKCPAALSGCHQFCHCYPNDREPPEPDHPRFTMPWPVRGNSPPRPRERQPQRGSGRGAGSGNGDPSPIRSLSLIHSRHAEMDDKASPPSPPPLGRLPPRLRRTPFEDRPEPGAIGPSNR